MIPNNNLSVLPWYTSLDQQNARKWWVYDKVYPLFTPAGYILPFQIMREHRLQAGSLITETSTSGGRLQRDGSIVIELNYTISRYENLPSTIVLVGGGTNVGQFTSSAFAIAYDDNDEVLEVVENETISERVWELPAGTSYVLTQKTGRDIPRVEYFKIYEPTIRTVHEVKIYTKENSLVAELNPSEMEFTVKPFVELGYDVIVYPGLFPATLQMNNGQYYATLSDGVDTWYSEIFTVVNDISGYLKLEWWDREDFVMDAGTIVYKNPAFKNVLYLCSDIAKPEYDFDDQIIERGGYTFPVEQVSKKRYRFSFFASEYLLDVLRFVRMSDYAQITSHGQLYTMDTFLITPEWEDNGDVAGVDAEFTTATVAKKIGVGYIKSQRVDFNDDFNEDYN